ncbi:hypothetical protein [Microbacterium sp. LWH11-1.2]|uniref:DUF7455 domain-containing protein n=1 Tax=Microbacterium sp. LWH11-1.2 TaxID=3135258 RepID=UPI0031389221
MDEQTEFYDLADKSMTYCDRCGKGTTALIYVAMPAGNELKYCAHHAGRYRANLNLLGAFLYELSA